MNRLTVRLYDNVVSLKNADEFNLDNNITKAIQKLAAYEDTGLEPEETKYLKTELDLIREFNALQLAEVRRFRDLEEQGLLVKLPCKVGSTVYRILYDRNIENSKVESFEFSEEGIFVRVSYESPIAYITSSYPIEDLFLTREEAEKILKESEEK